MPLERPDPFDDGEAALQQGPEESLIRLLDHIAAELAEEYAATTRKLRSGSRSAASSTSFNSAT